jgi:uncharacterized protein
MPRPPKCRRVERMPVNTYFKPAGISLKDLDEVILSVDELEAIRLKDMDGLEQAEGAERMRVSRPTFQRILTEARVKIASALIEGKAIRIEGGHFELMCRKFRCECGHECEIPHGTGKRGREIECPDCHRVDMHRIGTGGPCRNGSDME